MNAVEFEFDTFRENSNLKPECLIVILHGLGSNKDRLANTARFFAESIPQSVVVVPEAPFFHHLSETQIENIKKHMPEFTPERSKSWCEMGGKLPLRIAFNRLQIIHDFNGFIDERLRQYGLDDERLVLFGFSQGGGMALYSAIKRDRPCAAVIAHSAPFFGLTSAKVRPPVMMLIGEKDIETINNLKGPSNWLTSFLFSHQKSLERLADRGIQADNKIVPGLGHEITKETLAISVDFAQRRLGL